MMRWEALRGDEPLNGTHVAASGKLADNAGGTNERVFASALSGDTTWHDWREGAALGAAGG